MKTEQLVINGKLYSLVPPDGGWGWVVAISTFVVYACTIIPMNSFGLIYGTFLASIGDETTGTTLSNGVFNTVMFFMGLVANGVLNKFSYRKVGLAGTAIFFVGSFGIIFSKNLIQFILFFGVIQGMGFGLMMPAVLSALNSYFVKRMALVMSLAQALMIIFSMLIPQVVPLLLQSFEYRGMLIVLTVVTLLGIPANIVLQPVKRHLKKVPVESGDETVTVFKPSLQSTLSLSSKGKAEQIEPLLSENKHVNLHGRSARPKPRMSVVSLADRFASVTNINELNEPATGKDADESSFWKSLLESMDMSLLKDLKYLNISIGLSLCYTSDMAFISIIPVMLGSSGFSSQEVASIVTVYFGVDLVARISLTIVSGIFKLKSRYLVFMSALFSGIFRIVLVLNNTYLWKMCILAVLGFLRCFIQTPLAVVISEEYTTQFASAFSLYMAINGVVSLIFGLLMSFIKTYTHSDIMVSHSLTVAFAICVITWIAEMILCRKKSNDKEAEEETADA